MPRSTGRARRASGGEHKLSGWGRVACTAGQARASPPGHPIPGEAGCARLARRAGGAGPEGVAGVGAIWAFALPSNAFWSIASVLGFLLVFKGTLDIISAFMTKEVNSAWWLGLVAGILELVLGFWASQQLFPARGALLLLWVGFFALFRGISEIVIAFEVRHLQHA